MRNGVVKANQTTELERKRIISLRKDFVGTVALTKHNATTVIGI